MHREDKTNVNNYNGMLLGVKEMKKSGFNPHIYSYQVEDQESGIIFSVIDMEEEAYGFIVLDKKRFFLIKMDDNKHIEFKRVSLN